MTTRREVLGFAALLAAGVGMSGCGVPDESRPLVVGEAPGLGGTVNRPGSVVLPTPAGANTPAVLVSHFLQAGAAADWDPARLKERRIADAVNHARQFLAPPIRQSWTPVANFVLVVDADIQAGPSSVLVTLRSVGVLNENGSLDPVPDNVQMSQSVTFQTVEAAQASDTPLLLSNAPDYLMLSLEGLNALFEVRPVYYWSKGNRYLVPDRRYVSKGVSEEKRIKAILDQLLAGPSTFLKDFVEPLRVDELADNPLLNDDRVTVNFRTPAQGANPGEMQRRLAWQIRWSVHRASGQVSVTLQFDGRNQLTDDDGSYLQANPAQPAQGRSTLDDDRLFAILDGRVMPVFGNASRPPILDAPENSSVLLAAVNRPNRMVALVRSGQGGAPELWLGRTGGEPPFVKAELPAASAMSRPSYLPGTDGRLLIAVDKTLYDVAPDGTARPVQQSPAQVTAVSVAPDGARVALIAGGRALVAPLDATGTVRTLGPSRELFLAGATDLRGIGWLYEHRVVVASVGVPAVALIDVAVDNGYVKSITPNNLALAQLTQLSAVPGNPIDDVRGNVVVEAVDRGNRQAYYPYLELTQIPLPAASPGPSAGPSGSPGGTDQKRFVAPFYADDVR